MNHSRAVITTDLVQARKIMATSLCVKEFKVRRKFKPRAGVHCVKIKQELVDKLRNIRHELHKTSRALRSRLRELDGRINAVQQEIASIEQDLISGVIPNPELEAFFKTKLNRPVTVTTMSTAIGGAVVLVGTDIVQIRENNGDMVLTPYSKIITAS